MPSMIPNIRTWNRRRIVRLFQRIVILIAVAWTVIELLYVKTALVRESVKEPPRLGHEKIFICSIHWNNARLLHTHWSEALINIAKEIGRENAYVSLQASASFDTTIDEVRELRSMLEDEGISHKVILDNTTHFDEIIKPPAEEGWIRTPRRKVELRRIPYLAKLRNLVLEPLYELEEAGVKFDKILFINDVVFNNRDVRNLVATRNGDYAAACSLDYKFGDSLYDTFALRDAEGNEPSTLKWPHFRARKSHQAMKASLPVPVTSCWNGIVAMNAAPFYEEKRLAFRGISDSLAKSHVEGSECCLIHADNPLSSSKGVWVNPNVRVGYDSAAYEAVHSLRTEPWVSNFDIVWGAWKNRLIRWLWTTAFKDGLIRQRLQMWKRRDPDAPEEPGKFCLVNEMQVLVWNGWAHV